MRVKSKLRYVFEKKKLFVYFAAMLSRRKPHLEIRPCVKSRFLQDVQNNHGKIIDRVVALVDEGWPFTRGSNKRALTRKIVVFLDSVHLWQRGGHKWWFNCISTDRAYELTT